MGVVSFRSCCTENNGVCTFKTLPCVLSKCSRVCRQNARVSHKTHPLDGTHGSVLQVHTGASRADCISVPLFILSNISLFLCPSLFLSLSLFLLSALFFCSMAMTMIARPVGLSVLLVHSLSDEHVRIMQVTIVQLFLCKSCATLNEVGLSLCWKEECAWCGVVCLCCVFVRVGMY